MAAETGLSAAKPVEEASFDHRIEVLYSELRAMARQQMQGERSNHTLQATALAHEAFLRLRDQGQATWSCRAHFVTAAATAIRRILVEHARRNSRQKRGGGSPIGRLDEDPAADPPARRILAVDEALQRLARISADRARLVELKFFGGMTTEEVATILEVSASSVARQWRMTRAWLQAELEDLDGEVR